jgi:hypothetical protein
MEMGTIENAFLESDKLGLNQLTDEERLDMISYDESGNVHVKAICEDCYESLLRNPDFYQNDYLIH